VRSRAQLLGDVLEAVLLVLVVYTLVNLLTARFIVEGRSMEPSFYDGQYIVVSRLEYMFDAPKRGDVIVFHSPEDPDRDFIKRIIGLPGEQVYIEAGQVYIDSAPLDEPYIQNSFTYSSSHAWTLGPDEYFVLGDNRNNSNDSHDFGPVNRSAIIGRAWVSYWPIARWGVVPHHNYTLNAVPAPGG
jgi:signal peptidase I